MGKKMICASITLVLNLSGFGNLTSLFSQKKHFPTMLRDFKSINPDAMGSNKN
jgi:hypothetical protein